MEEEKKKEEAEKKQRGGRGGLGKQASVILALATSRLPDPFTRIREINRAVG